MIFFFFFEKCIRGTLSGAPCCHWFNDEEQIMMVQNDYLSMKRDIGVEKNSKVKSAQAWAVEG